MLISVNGQYHLSQSHCFGRMILKFLILVHCLKFLKFFTKPGWGGGGGEGGRLISIVMVN